MALYQTETVSSMSDFVTKLHTYLTTAGAGNPGWTSDLSPTSGKWAISKDDATTGEAVEVAFAWDTGSPNAMSVLQYYTGLGAGNYNTGANPWAQTGDSGNGAASQTDATILTSRHVTITNTPERYWAFCGDTYAHVFVRYSSAVYSSFGFGVLSKYSDWTGGAYAFGHKFQTGVASNVGTNARNSFFMDSLAVGTSPDAMQNFAATLHIEGLTNQVAGGIWGVALGQQASGSLGNDRQGTPKARVHIGPPGGFRGGSFATEFGQYAGSVQTGLIPTYPIVVFHWDRTGGGFHGPLGVMPDIRGIMISNFEAEDEVDIGGDTWTIFPTRRKGEAGSLNNTTGHQGIAVKQN